MPLRLPSPGVRTVAVLMLLAGLALGVAAARTLWAEKPRPPLPVLDQAIEAKVHRYVEMYRLDPQEADRVRRRLQKHDQGVTELYRQLRVEKRAAFQDLIEATEADLDAVFKGALERRSAGSPQVR